MNPFGDRGPCVLLFGVAPLERIIGRVGFYQTLGVVEVYDHTRGRTPVDSIVTGGACRLEVTLAQVDLETLTRILPGAIGAAGSLYADLAPGTSLATLAQTLIVMGLVDGAPDPDPSRHLTIYRAAPLPAVELPYDVDGVRAIRVDFRCYRDEARGGYWQTGSPFTFPT